jgi:FMN phosphatase YigB (HAD superfamily)
VTADDPVVFLLDVDNTLLDNDRIREDMQAYLRREFGAAGERYWTIQERLFVELGYRDYLGALQQHRVEHPDDDPLFAMSSYLLDYPFADRLYPGVLDLLQRLAEWGCTVILSDGDVVFQPRKVERSGLAAAVAGRYLIYVHKEEELADVERRYPASHYVLVDDKLRILSAAKQFWGARVTTVFPRQGQIAQDPNVLAAFPAADLTVARVGDLLACALSDLLASQAIAPHRSTGQHAGHKDAP